MDDVTKVLAEATFRAGFGDPQADDVSRAWQAIEGRVGYREAQVRNQLNLLGYDVVKLDA